MACDICSKAGVPVETLPEAYATREVRVVCAECSDVINAKNGALLKMVLQIKADLLKRFIARRREKFDARRR